MFRVIQQMTFELRELIQTTIRNIKRLAQGGAHSKPAICLTEPVPMLIHFINSVIITEVNYIISGGVSFMSIPTKLTEPSLAAWTAIRDRYASYNGQRHASVQLVR